MIEKILNYFGYYKRKAIVLDFPVPAKKKPTVKKATTRKPRQI